MSGFPGTFTVATATPFPRNHLTLFTIHLGLVELSRPHLFHPSCLPALEAALSCYTDVYQAYIQRRDAFQGTIDRLACLLRSWQVGPTTCNPLVILAEVKLFK